MFAPEMLDRHYYLLFGLGLAMVRGLADKETWEGRG
jgi:hypothetical protein